MNDTTTRCSAIAAIERDAAFSSMVVGELDVFFFYLTYEKRRRSYNISKDFKPKL